MPMFRFIILLLEIAAYAIAVTAWSTSTHFTHSTRRRISPWPFANQHRLKPPYHNTKLYAGKGTATTYSWKEEQFEIEVSIAVPPNTTANDVRFKCTSNGIDLRLNSNEGETILLDGNRNTRGKICVDGTFWSISDSSHTPKQREITVTIEKQFIPTSTSAGIQTYDSLTEFDWGGIYPNDGEEVTFRKYDVAEELNVKEYASKLGVDIDNIDMSKVDKSMFGSGLGDASSLDPTNGGEGSKKSSGSQLNITQATLDQLVKFGLAKEVVRQGDGTEYEMDAFANDLERKEFSMLGKDISVDEMRDAGVVSGGDPVNGDNFNIPNQVGDEIKDDDVGQKAELVDEEPKHSEKEDEADATDPNAKDPIDKLTVKKLKEILRQEGLKVSGTKSELQARLREHVQVLLEESGGS